MARKKKSSGSKKSYKGRGMLARKAKPAGARKARSRAGTRRTRYAKK